MLGNGHMHACMQNAGIMEVVEFRQFPDKNKTNKQNTKENSLDFGTRNWQDKVEIS